MLKIIENIEKIIIVLVCVLFPIFFITEFVNVFFPAKTAFLVTGVLLLVALKLVKIIGKESIDFSTSKFDAAVFLLTAAYLASALIKSPNRMEAFFIPGTATVVLACSLFYFTLNQGKNKSLVKLGLIISGAIVSLISLLVYTKVLSSLPGIPGFFKSPSFSLTGGVIPQIVFLLPLLVLGVLSVIYEKKVKEKVAFGFLSFLTAFGLLVSIYTLIPQKDQVFPLPSLTTTWTVAIDTFKESPLFGVGVDNYKFAFDKFRPISYNQSKLWSTRFNTANNFYLTLWTETGIIGLLAIALVILFAIKSLPVNKQEMATKSANIALVCLLLTALIMPFNLVNIFLLFVLFSLSSSTTKIHLPIIPDLPYIDKTRSQSYKIPVYIVTIPLLILIAYALAVEIKLITAESHIASAVKAETQKDGGTTTKTHLSKAIEKNNKMDNYYLYAARIDIAIANIIAKKDPRTLTDQEKSAISSYIQEAISLAKQAVAINPQKAENWEFLGNIYRSIMPYAKDVDQFAIQSYSQAIILDPVNPFLRLSLGGIYYSTGNFENAVDVFKLATVVKPDYPNAHYNLAISYRENKQIDKAISEMKIVMGLVNKDSEDYKLAKKELENLEARKPANEALNAGELTTPKESEPIIDPQLELSADSQPPVVASPIPTPLTSPTPSQIPN